MREHGHVGLEAVRQTLVDFERDQVVAHPFADHPGGQQRRGRRFDEPQRLPEALVLHAHLAERGDLSLQANDAAAELQVFGVDLLAIREVLDSVDDGEDHAIDSPLDGRGGGQDDAVEGAQVAAVFGVRQPDGDRENEKRSDDDQFSIALEKCPHGDPPFVSCPGSPLGRAVFLKAF